MPTHLDPAFLEPVAPAPVERDTETGDLFAQPADHPEESKDDAEGEARPLLRMIVRPRRGGSPEHISRPLARVLVRLLSRLVPPPPAQRPAA